MKKSILIILVLLVFSSCTSNDPEIAIDNPSVDDTVGCPLFVEGQAIGPWFFEASFPIELLDQSNRVIYQGIALATDEWTTEDFVPFKAEIYYNSDGEDATLVFSKSNPSALPENADSFSMPIVLSNCSEKL